MKETNKYCKGWVNTVMFSSREILVIAAKRFDLVKENFS
jgi:hypothetical protein